MTRTLRIKCNGTASLRPVIYIDGKAVKIKKNRFGNYLIEHKTEKDNAEVVIRQFPELSGRLWLIMALLFYFISIFGIFNPPYERRCLNIKCRFTVYLGEGNTDLSLVFRTNKAGGRALELNEGAPVEEFVNECTVDVRAKNRLRVVRVLQAIGWVAFIVAAVMVISRYI